MVTVRFGTGSGAAETGCAAGCVGGGVAAGVAVDDAVLAFAAAISMFELFAGLVGA